MNEKFTARKYYSNTNDSKRDDSKPSINPKFNPKFTPNTGSISTTGSIRPLTTMRPLTTVKPSVNKRYAFAIIHFGSNPVYLELELYFFKMLHQYTKHDIIYLYSINDTPPSFVELVRRFVTEVVPYDDKGITYEVAFKSEYTNFNTLRTCNFIFAYTLEQYDTVCIIESDMVIMKDLDPIFSLRSPAVLTYYIGDRRLQYNDEITNNPSDVLAKCKDMGRVNGGVMLIKPSRKLFDTYKSKIVDVVRRECKYPNESLFEYVNNSYYNLPIQYNLSHFLAKTNKLQSYGLTARDIYIYHFNETKYKHIDIIKNPTDDNGDNWIEIIQRDKKYEIKQLPILHYKNTVYDRYHTEISALLKSLDKPSAKEKPKSPVSPKKDELRPISPLHLQPKSKSSSPKSKSLSSKSLSLESKSLSPKSKSLSPKSKSLSPKSLSKSLSSKSSSKSSSSSISSSKSQKSKCPKGTRRNKKTGNCDPHTKQPRCPTGAHRNKKTDNCDPRVKQPKCPKGTRRNKKTGNCEKII